MRKILFVDDEPNILQGLKRMLRPMRHEWEMFFCESADIAKDVLKAHGADVIVSDMRMPKLDGAALLDFAKTEYPETARIILSGHSEQEMTIRSIVATHQFLAKPCDADTLRGTILRTLKLREMLRSARLKRIVSEVGQLPSVPEIYKELNAEMGKEDASIARAAAIVERDLGMSAKILQLVNSAFFGLPRQVDSVQQAVSFLGIDVIRALVLSQSAFKSFQSDDVGIDASLLMRRAQAVASIAHAIAKAETKNQAMIDDVFQAAMLHELGRLILAAELPDDFRACAKRIEAGEVSEVAEHDVFDVTQGEVGAYLLGLWGMSDGVVESVAYYQRPNVTEVNDFQPLVAVHVAAALEASLNGRSGLPLNETWLTEIGFATQLETWKDLAEARSVHEDAA